VERRGTGGFATAATTHQPLSQRAAKTPRVRAPRLLPRRIHSQTAASTYAKEWISLIDGIDMGGGVWHIGARLASVATRGTVLFAMPAETTSAFFPIVGGGIPDPPSQVTLGNLLALTSHRLKLAERCLWAGIIRCPGAEREDEPLQAGLGEADRSGSDAQRKVMPCDSPVRRRCRTPACGDDGRHRFAASRGKVGWRDRSKLKKAGRRRGGNQLAGLLVKALAASLCRSRSSSSSAAQKTPPKNNPPKTHNPPPQKKIGRSRIE